MMLLDHRKLLRLRFASRIIPEALPVNRVEVWKRAASSFISYDIRSQLLALRTLEGLVWREGSSEEHL